MNPSSRFCIPASQLGPRCRHNVQTQGHEVKHLEQFVLGGADLDVTPALGEQELNRRVEANSLMGKAKDQVQLFGMYRLSSVTGSNHTTKFLIQSSLVLFPTGHLILWSDKDGRHGMN